MLIHSPPQTDLRVVASVSYEWPMKTLPINSKQDDDDESARCDWDFNLSAAISSSGGSSDAIGVVEFDEAGALLATGGIARKIRIYAAEKSLKSGGGEAEMYLCTSAKLSSLKWRPGSGSGVMGSGDYDGVVMEYDLARRLPVFERDEHGGRRVWSIDYSRWEPALGASASDDGTMQMWDPRCEGGGRLAPVRPDRAAASPVCCVEFNPFGGPHVVVGCADRRAYVYDVRRAADPVFVMGRHERAVTYAKFLDPRTIVSSSVDGCLMMWDAEDNRLIRTYRGHVNTRRFVGLSVWRSGGLFSCGSENNRVYVYDRRWSRPVWVRGLETASRPCNEPGFVSGVCWRQTGEEDCMLVVGASDGTLQVFEGHKKTQPHWDLGGNHVT